MRSGQACGAVESRDPCSSGPFTFPFPEANPTGAQAGSVARSGYSGHTVTWRPPAVGGPSSLARCLNAPPPVNDYDVLRVFCAPHGGYGNELGVVRDGSVVPERAERQALAARLGSGETVCVDDPERGVTGIYTPALRLPFAGHPCAGAARLLDVPELLTAPQPDGWVEIGGRALLER